MNEALWFLAAPTVMCLVLTGIHCYLGLHVLARGVIFLDLSLAQVAALGATVAWLLGYEHDSQQTYFFSLGATILAASLFAWARKNESYFSQEAMIGIVYAFGAAAVILLLDRSAHGGEHIKELLIGQILWVTWPTVLKTSVIYCLIGAIHYIFRHALIAASFQTGGPGRTFWDWIFYASFGVVITSSVSVVGVLQVFAYLIVPSVVSSLFCRSIKGRLFLGWGLGVVLSILGMSLSYVWDFPTGAFLVVCFTLVPILLMTVLPLRKSSG